MEPKTFLANSDQQQIERAQHKYNILDEPKRTSSIRRGIVCENALVMFADTLWGAGADGSLRQQAIMMIACVSVCMHELPDLRSVSIIHSIAISYAD